MKRLNKAERIHAKRFLLTPNNIQAIRARQKALEPDKEPCWLCRGIAKKWGIES